MVLLPPTITIQCIQGIMHQRRAFSMHILAPFCGVVIVEWLRTVKTMVLRETVDARSVLAGEGRLVTPHLTSTTEPSIIAEIVSETIRVDYERREVRGGL